MLKLTHFLGWLFLSLTPLVLATTDQCDDAIQKELSKFGSKIKKWKSTLDDGNLKVEKTLYDRFFKRAVSFERDCIFEGGFGPRKWHEPQIGEDQQTFRSRIIAELKNVKNSLDERWQQHLSTKPSWFRSLMKDKNGFFLDFIGDLIQHEDTKLEFVHNGVPLWGPVTRSNIYEERQPPPEEPPAKKMKSDPDFCPVEPLTLRSTQPLFMKKDERLTTSIIDSFEKLKNEEDKCEGPFATSTLKKGSRFWYTFAVRQLREDLSFKYRPIWDCRHFNLWSPCYERLAFPSVGMLMDLFFQYKIRGCSGFRSAEKYKKIMSKSEYESNMERIVMKPDVDSSIPMSTSLADSAKELCLVVADFASAFFQLTTLPLHYQHSNALVWFPNPALENGGSWKYYRCRFTGFGNIWSLMAWCRLAMLFQSVLRRLLLMPFMIYVDDCFSIMLKKNSAHALEIMLEFFAICGYRLSEEKCWVSMMGRILGVNLCLYGTYMTLTVAAEKVRKTKKVIQEMLERDVHTYSYHDFAVLIGRCMHLGSTLRENSLKRLCSPFFSLLNKENYLNEKIQLLKDGLDFQQQLQSILIGCANLKSCTFSAPAMLRRVCKVVTDASLSHVGGYLEVWEEGELFYYYFCESIPIWLQTAVKSSSGESEKLINVWEMLASMLAMRFLATVLDNCFVDALTDNSTAYYGICSGWSRSPWVDVFCRKFHFAAVSSSLYVTGFWVHTGFNPADGFTRPELIQPTLAEFKNRNSKRFTPCFTDILTQKDLETTTQQSLLYTEKKARKKAQQTSS